MRKRKREDFFSKKILHLYKIIHRRCLCDGNLYICICYLCILPTFICRLIIFYGIYIFFQNENYLNNEMCIENCARKEIKCKEAEVIQMVCFSRVLTCINIHHIFIYVYICLFVRG